MAGRLTGTQVRGGVSEVSSASGGVALKSRRTGGAVRCARGTRGSRGHVSASARSGSTLSGDRTRQAVSGAGHADVAHQTVTASALTGSTLSDDGTSVTVGCARQTRGRGDVHVAGFALSDGTLVGGRAGVAVDVASGTRGSDEGVSGRALSAGALGGHGTLVAISRTRCRSVKPGVTRDTA